MDNVVIGVMVALCLVGAMSALIFVARCGYRAALFLYKMVRAVFLTVSALRWYAKVMHVSKDMRGFRFHLVAILGVWWKMVFWINGLDKLSYNIHTFNGYRDYEVVGYFVSSHFKANDRKSIQLWQDPLEDF